MKLSKCVYISVTYCKNATHQRCKLTNLSDINGPNKIDHRCPLKRGNTQSNYLAHNIYIGN